MNNETVFFQNRITFRLILNYIRLIFLVLFTYIFLTSRTNFGIIIGSLILFIFLSALWFFSSRETIRFKISNKGFLITKLSFKRFFIPIEQITKIKIEYVRAIEAGTYIHFTANEVKPSKWNRVRIRQMNLAKDWVPFFHFLFENNIEINVEEALEEIQNYYKKAIDQYSLKKTLLE